MLSAIFANCYLCCLQWDVLFLDCVFETTIKISLSFSDSFFLVLNPGGSVRADLCGQCVAIEVGSP